MALGFGGLAAAPSAQRLVDEQRQRDCAGSAGRRTRWQPSPGAPTWFVEILQHVGRLPGRGSSGTVLGLSAASDLLVTVTVSELVDAYGPERAGASRPARGHHR